MNRNSESIINVIVIPSYNEELSLPVLLESLVKNLDASDSVIVIDDSATEIYLETKIRIQTIFEVSEAQFQIINNPQKGGRGAAVRMGITLAISKYPNLKFLIESDADGSHTAEDILRMRKDACGADMLIGSRYMRESLIIGWPLSRRVLSKALNQIIPWLLQVPTSDITNGLRKYSNRALSSIISHEQINTGFIYLSEQAMIINRCGLRIEEIPTNFINRLSGESSVTWRELVSALLGILKLLFRSVVRGNLIYK